MGRALNLLRDQPHYRKRCFSEGLAAAGFRIVDDLDDPIPGDVLLTWNRYHKNHDLAKRFESAGARVLVAENAYLPLKGWYALAEGHHAGLGKWPVGGPQRWRGLGIDVRPWRRGGTETVILAQRGIGARGIGSPPQWAERAQRRIAGRIRPHPGRHAENPPLETDLARAREVVTWGSAAAIRALVFGVPVFHELRGWIGAPASRHIDDYRLGPVLDDAARLATLERLAWAQSSVDEIRSGEAFCRLLGR